jgi:magnesium chelatase subunit I
MSTMPLYPFTAIVGQEDMKLALILNIIDPTIGGVLIRGEKGTAKSTAMRGLADILPLIRVVEDCPFQLPEVKAHAVCGQCMDHLCRNGDDRDAATAVVERKIIVVELPVGATEDRLVGTLNLEHALKEGEKRFEPGILAQAHRGILYVDEVNLLDDHLVDVLLDSAAMGVNTVEREGVSFVHPSRFTLVGTMNPEEGDLRPQLLDRFGLCVNVEGIRDAQARVAIMERRIQFDENPERFSEQWSSQGAKLLELILPAQQRYHDVKVDESILRRIASACAKLQVGGHRGDIVTLKTAKAHAAYCGLDRVRQEDLLVAANLALLHRVRRTPFDGIVKEVAAEITRAFSEEN